MEVWKGRKPRVNEGAAPKKKPRRAHALFYSYFEGGFVGHFEAFQGEAGREEALLRLQGSFFALQLS